MNSPTRERWQQLGSEYTASWAGQNWTLRPEGPRPGLIPRDGFGGELLALDGLAAPGRRDHQAFSAASLVSVELFRSRVQATYAPSGWGSIQIRASWCLDQEGNRVDLEVQATAFSVGELRAVEVLVASGAPSLPDDLERSRFRVQPRDRRAASLSYDGREPIEVLRRLWTEPLPAMGNIAVKPGFLASGQQESGGTFVEMVHPDDVARRILREDCSDDGGSSVTSICNGLFGHDLEKGVVLRGRLRGLWLPGSGMPDRNACESEFQRFLDQPPPLGM